MLFKKPCLFLLVMAGISIASAAFCQTSQEGFHLALTPYAEMYQQKKQPPAKKETLTIPDTKQICMPDTCKSVSPKYNCTVSEKSKLPEKPHP